MNEKLKKTHSFLQTPFTNDGRMYFHPILMMYASKKSGKTYTEFMTDYRVLVETNIKCLEMHDHDAVSVISDPYRETSAFGAKVVFEGDKSPKAEKLVTCSADVIKLVNPDVYSCERTLDRIKGVEYYRELLGKKFPIIGWVEGSLAETADLCGVSETMMNMMMEPDMVKDVGKICLETGKDFALAQIKAGANIMGVGDAVCSQISVEMYDEFCLPLHRELFHYIRLQGALVKLHICGNITHLLPSLSQLDIDILDIDWMVDITEAHKIMGPGVMICGNLDPVSVIMEGSEQTIKDKYLETKSKIPRENWIMMGGCEIPPGTSVDNMNYLRQISL